MLNWIYSFWTTPEAKTAAPAAAARYQPPNPSTDFMAEFNQEVKAMSEMGVKRYLELRRMKRVVLQKPQLSDEREKSKNSLRHSIG